MESVQLNTKTNKGEFISTFEFYSQIIDSLQDYAIFTTDKELRINSWNTGSSRIFGYESEEVIGNPCEVIFTEEDRKNNIMKIKIETALKEGRVADSRWHVHKDGSLFWAYGVIFPLMGDDGELLGYVKILRDLTERKKSEDAIQKYIKELEELNKHKENILAILSHDLRSPLSTIVGIADYLTQDIDQMAQSEVKRMVKIIDKESTQELNMLDYLLEWARIKYASDIFSPTTIDLGKIVGKVFGTFKEIAVSKKINLQNQIEKNIHVFADEKMLQSILQNLVSNALKHTLKGGDVILTAFKRDDMMLIRVKDNGIGMSKKMQENLFTPQINVLSIAREENKGAGIGLLLVKGFVEKNGGEICVESIKGEGSSFYFTLPIEKPLEHVDSIYRHEFDESA
ncbi:MAG TPA: hypothetical protein DCL77_07000 [Prolixibacteraceae bacterium]|jgi:two-component system CheB/CheR fusion protein|nr:hypothetical protein [Prolixibacteraceae bacterium]